MRSRRLAPGAVALAIAGPIVGASNFAFHGIASRALGPDGYGGLNALLGLTIAVAVPAAAVQVTLARSLLSGGVSAGHLRRIVSIGATTLAIMTLGVAPVVGGGLKLGGAMPVVVLVGYLVATAVGLVPKAVLVAQERLGMLAAGTLLGVVVRLTLGVVWVSSGGSLVAAVAAGSIGELAATGFLLWVTREEYATDTGTAGSWRAHVGPVLGFGSLWALLAVDTAASRSVMSGTASGVYAAAAVLARGVLFLPANVATAAFARLADPVTRPRALSWATATALTLSVLGVCGLALFGRPAAAVLFGSGFIIDLRILVLLGASAAVLAVANVWVHARVAYGQPTGVRLLFALVVVALGAAPAASFGPTALASWMVIAAMLTLWLVRPHSAVAVPFPDPNAVPGDAGLDATVVVPAFNVAGRVGAHLKALEQVLTSTGRSFEVLVVDDGSADATVAEAEAALGPHGRVLRTAHRGKGAALRTGMAEARGQLVGFIDADGDISPAVLPRLIEATMVEGVDGAVAVKSDPTSRGTVRRMASYGYRLLVRGTLSVTVSDTQTGAKMFRRATVAAVLPWTAEDGFAWDAEFLASGKRLGFGSYTEVPVEVISSPSTIDPRAVWAMLRATIRVASRVAMLPDYHPHRAGAQGAVTEAAHPAVPTQVETRPERPLRILILNWKCSRHPAAGGAEVYTHEVARRWAAAGHDVTWFAPAVAGAPDVEMVSGYRVHRRGGRLSVYREARRFWFEHRDDFDVIVDEVNTRPFEAPLWADVPVVGCVHQLAREMWFYELPTAVAVAGRYVLEPNWIRAYRDVPVTTISDSSAASLRRAGLGRVMNVGVGISLPDGLQHPLKGTVPSVAFVGRMVSAKRPLDALTAFGLARDELGAGELALIGDGPIGDVVRAATERVAGARFWGRVSEAEKFGLLGQAHVLVATSVREGWGLVVDEAAAMGVYPIGYRVPGLTDSIPAAGGTLVDPNPEALAAALIEHLPRLVRGPAPLRSGGARSWDEVADRLLAVLATATRPMVGV